MKTPFDAPFLYLVAAFFALELSSTGFAGPEKHAVYTLERIQQLLIKEEGEGIRELTQNVKNGERNDIVELLVQILRTNQSKEIAVHSSLEMEVGSAIWVLSKIGDDATVLESLKPYLNHSSKEIQGAAIGGLGRTKSAQASTLLEDILLKKLGAMPNKLSNNQKGMDQIADLYPPLLALNEMDTHQSRNSIEKFFGNISKRYGGTSEGKELMQIFKDEVSAKQASALGDSEK